MNMNTNDAGSEPEARRGRPSRAPRRTQERPHNERGEQLEPESEADGDLDVSHGIKGA